MSLYLASNKPRSLFRQPPTFTCPDSPIPPKLEHSLDEWLGQNSNYGHFVSSIKSGPTPQASLDTLLQNDTSQLSTSPPPLLMSTSCSSPANLTSDQQLTCPCCQIPQCKAWKKMASSVKKLETETCLAAEIGQSLLEKNESCRMESNQLKTKLKHYQDRIHELETSLADSESFARQMNWEKEKWKRQGERSEKNLNRSMKDLEMTHTKYAIVTKELEQAKHKVEKLELFKCKSQQFDIREEALKIEIEELKNELALSRKNEINLTLENKILTKANDMLSRAYQDLVNKHSTKSNSCHVKPSSSSPAISTPATRNKCIIKNFKSEKSELINTTTRLDDTGNELLDDTLKPALWNQYLDRTRDSKETHRRLCSDVEQQSRPVRTPVSSPLLHHLSGIKTSSLKTTMTKETRLLDQARDILCRIHATDMRTLNRRLQRTFDIDPLSQMSDTLLQNIITEVDTLDARFFWLTPDDDDDDDDQRRTDDHFAAWVHLLQDLLKEIAQSAITMNQYKVAYVKKIKENVKVENPPHSWATPIPDPLCTEQPTNSMESPRTDHTQQSCKAVQTPLSSIWSSTLSFIMDEWNLMTFSSSLDREFWDHSNTWWARYD